MKTYTKQFIEFRTLEEMAEYLGFAFPDEIYEIADDEGFYTIDEQGDPIISKIGINGYLERMGANFQVISWCGGIMICEVV